MSMTIRIEVVSAEAKTYSGTAEMVIIPAMMGEMGVIARHASLLTLLKPGCLRIVIRPDEEEIFYVNGGFAEVQPHLITILSDTALRADSLDETAVLEVKRRAEAELSKTKTNLDYSRAMAELAQALAQLRTIEQLRKKLNVK